MINNDDVPQNNVFVYIEDTVNFGLPNSDIGSGEKQSFSACGNNDSQSNKTGPFQAEKNIPRRNPPRKAKSNSKDEGRNPKNDKKNKGQKTQNKNSNKKRKTRSRDNQDPFSRIPFRQPPSFFGGMPPIFSILFTGDDEDDGGCRNPKYKSMKDRIKKSNLDEKTKQMCLDRLKNSDSDKQKHMEWFENLLKIPFGKFANMPININNSTEKIHEYFETCMNKLNDSVHGLDKVKEEILNYIAQFVSTDNKSSPRVIGLQGSAGVGKTQLIKRGLSECLGRPMKFLSMGGIRDSSHFLGFEFTYSGSRHGIIVQSLIDTGVMNPIIFMDELDKVSNTTDGIDVQNLLIHLTDPVQNMEFHDKYFAGINIDLSKVVLVFSFNDIDLINPILKDRINIIKVPDPDEKAKIVIGQKFLVKEIAPNIGLNIDDIIFPEETIKHIITSFCKNDKGVRGLKKCIETVMLKINTARFLGKLQKYKILEKELKKEKYFPLTVTKEIVDELIQKEHNPKDEIMMHMFT